MVQGAIFPDRPADGPSLMVYSHNRPCAGKIGEPSVVWSYESEAFHAYATILNHDLFKPSTGQPSP